MANIKEIQEELSSYPRGYISTKKINGKTYSYLQYNENGSKKSKYISYDELDCVKEGIAQRKVCEDILDELDRSERRMKAPGKSMASLTGYLMMGDRVVAFFKDGIAAFVNYERVPLLIKRTGNLSLFLEGRAIDRDRTHARLLKKFLDIHEEDDAMVSLYSYGACITDNYWFKSINSSLKYSDISFTNDEYSDLALKGDVGFVPKDPRHTPQLTVRGSYEKCWKLLNGEWWLYKTGNKEEIFSELFCSSFAQKFGIKSAIYEYDEGYIRSKNFAWEYNLEPVSSIAGDDDNYEVVFEALYKLSPKLAKEYVKLICFDAVVNNVDRHNENCGILRDRETGKIVSLAPNYDNNRALTSVTNTLFFTGKNDGHFSFLERFLKKNNKAKDMFISIKFKDISEMMIKACIPAVETDKDISNVVTYVSKRYEYLRLLQKALYAK